MVSPSETAHVQWLLKEKKRLEKVIASAGERKKRIDEETKLDRRKVAEVNKMIALYGEHDVDSEAVAVSDLTGRIKCSKCPMTFPSKPRVGEHLRRVHGIYGGLSGKVRGPGVGGRRPKAEKGSKAA